ncbi:hypothetical protein EBX31_13000 [bacterium]|nr:hypothetical protein [bacterium]
MGWQGRGGNAVRLEVGPYPSGKSRLETKKSDSVGGEDREGNSHRESCLKQFFLPHTFRKLSRCFQNQGDRFKMVFLYPVKLPNIGA